MKFTCNINSFGRTLRIVTGLILLADGVIMFMLDFPAPTWGWRMVQLLLTLMGAFAIFEGAVGWCALRSMGIRTKF